MEVTGIVISGVGLVALESTVEDILQKISTWRHHGQDYEHFSLQLDLAHMAYQRWQKTVKLVGPNTVTGLSKLPTASPHEAETVGKLLGAITSAFQDAEKTSQRYETGVDENVAPPDSLEARVQATIKARQSGTGVLQKARWVVHDKKALQVLTERVTTNVRQLVDMFPAATRQIQEKLAVLDVMDMVPSGETNERQQLVQLLAATKTVDPILQASASESIKQVDQRHTYLRMRTEGNAQMMNGDEIAAGCTAPGGPGHSHRDAVATGNSKMLNGDRVGMGSFFD